jgi:divalent metal cation (Fe/Co/Zn/Cd) transporter
MSRNLSRAPSWLAAVLLVAVAVVTLALRIVALSVALVADGADRAATLASAVDEALTARWGLAPLGSQLAVVEPAASSPWGAR